MFDDIYLSLSLNFFDRSEWLYLRAISYCRGLNSAVYFTSGKLVMFGTFTVYMYLGHRTNLSDLFVILALFETLRASVGLLLPWGIHYFRDALQAVAEIQVNVEMNPIVILLS